MSGDADSDQVYKGGAGAGSSRAHPTWLAAAPIDPPTHAPLETCLNKSEFIAALAEKTGLSKKNVEAVVDEMPGVIAGSIKDGGRLALAGLGSFEVRQKPERQGRNPKTGEAMTIAASRTPVFKAAKGLKELVA